MQVSSDHWAEFWAHYPSWMMSTEDRSALLCLLRATRPAIAIEIGTKDGGSTMAIAEHADKVYTIDIDHSGGHRHLSGVANIEMLTGYSEIMLPKLLRRLAGQPVGFILVDGEHSRDGVNRDIRSILAFTPTTPLYVLMHDCFNPECRAGILSAPWADNRFVHEVVADFTAGMLRRGQLWGGFAFARLMPEPRTGPLAIRQRGEEMFAALAGNQPAAPPAAINQPRRLARFLKRRIKTMAGVSGRTKV